MQRCDLHTHSYCSDGKALPAELVRLAEEAGLKAIALTDHNTAEGLGEFMRAGEKSSVITVAGCEFTTDYEGTELHIVGLFFPESAWVEIADFVEFMRMAKKHSNEVTIDALRKAGYDITYDEVAETSPKSEFNRSHVAEILEKKGYVKSIAEAFDCVLKEGNGFYVPPKRISALLAIRFIKDYGAVAVLAHPFLNLDYEGLLEFLPKAKEAGLDAIETHYSTFDSETTAKAEELAERFGLKQSGGSDYHGSKKPDIELGTGKGDLFVPFEFYEELKKCAKDS